MKSGRCLGACLVAAALQLGAAEAATRFSITSFNFGPSVDSFAAFDPSLGTLTSASFDLFGEFVPLILSDEAGHVDPLFVSRTYTGFGGRGFSTSVAPEFVGQILTGAPGSPALAIAPFRETFVFDEQSERIGFAASSAGAILTGRLAGFLKGGPSGDLILETPGYIARALSHRGEFLPSLTTFAVGGGLVTYTYETFPSGAVPEPAAWTLMLAGFAVVGADLRRKREQAREVRAERLCDQGWDIACKVTPETAYATRVQLAQLRWMTSYLAPRRFGRVKPLEAEVALETATTETGPGKTPPDAWLVKQFKVEERADGWRRMVTFVPDPRHNRIVRLSPEDAPWEPPPMGHFRPSKYARPVEG